MMHSELLQQTEKLSHHPVFGQISDIAALRRFMQWHVFAVWDFMSLVKALQAKLSCVQTPWLPPANPEAARLINEIVLAEESDVTPEGEYASHFELYLLAMREVGADTSAIEQLIENLQSGMPLDQALDACPIDAELCAFVQQTMQCVEQGDVFALLGNFFYGRENAIPQMFQGLLDQWLLEADQAPVFHYYLQRHIELDGDEHGPAAQRIIARLVGEDQVALNRLHQVAQEAIAARMRLWDALSASLSAQDASQPDSVVGAARTQPSGTLSAASA